MSEHLDIRTTLSAVDYASPVITKLLANVKELQKVAKRFNASFAGIGSNKMFDGLSGRLKKATDEVARSAETYRSSWDRAYTERLSEAKRLHAEINRLERQGVVRHDAHQQAMARSYRSTGRGGLPTNPSFPPFCVQFLRGIRPRRVCFPRNLPFCRLLSNCSI
jgi:hypothetical protein